MGFRRGTASVDARVTATEDGMIQKMRAARAGPTSDMDLPLRPGYGTVGTKTLVRANHFPVAIPQTTLFKYDVAMVPEIKIKRMKKRVFQLLEASALGKIKHLIATDYAKTIITPSRLTLPDDRLQVEVTYYDENQDGPTEKSKKYMVTIQLVQVIEPSELQKYVEGDSRGFDPGSAIQALNIILAKPPNSDRAIIPLGRSKFFVQENQPAELGRGLIALRGYYSSIRPSINRILCNVNVCMTAFYKYELYLLFFGVFAQVINRNW